MTRSKEILALMGGKEWLEFVISAKHIHGIETKSKSQYNEGMIFAMRGVRFGFKGLDGVRRVAEVKEYCYLSPMQNLHSQVSVYSRFWGRELNSVTSLKPISRETLNEMFHRVTNLHIHPFF